MEALAVIKDFDVVEESALGLGEVGEGFAFEVQFTFEGGPEAFHGGVVVAATGPAHAGSKAIGEELLLVGGAGVLAAAIGVVEQAGFGAPSLLGVSQGLKGQRSLQMIFGQPTVHIAEILFFPTPESGNADVQIQGEFGDAFSTDEELDGVAFELGGVTFSVFHMLSQHRV